MMNQKHRLSVIKSKLKCPLCIVKTKELALLSQYFHRELYVDS